MPADTYIMINKEVLKAASPVFEAKFTKEWKNGVFVCETKEDCTALGIVIESLFTSYIEATVIIYCSIKNLI